MSSKYTPFINEMKEIRKEFKRMMREENDNEVKETPSDEISEEVLPLTIENSNKGNSAVEEWINNMSREEFEALQIVGTDVSESNVDTNMDPSLLGVHQLMNRNLIAGALPNPTANDIIAKDLSSMSEEELRRYHDALQSQVLSGNTLDDQLRLQVLYRQKHMKMDPPEDRKARLDKLREEHESDISTTDTEIQSDYRDHQGILDIHSGYGFDFDTAEFEAHRKKYFDEHPNTESYPADHLDKLLNKDKEDD